MPHRIQVTAPLAPAEPFEALLGAVRRSGSPFKVHEHAPTRTVEEARGLPFDLSRLVKTIALSGLSRSARPEPVEGRAVVGVSDRLHKRAV